MMPTIQSISNLLATGVNSDLKFTVWIILLGVLLVFITFFALTRKNNRAENHKESKYSFNLILGVIFLVLLAGVESYFLLLPQINQDNVMFPSTGTGPTPQSVVQSADSLYATPLDKIITFSLLISILLLAAAVFRNITARKRIEKDLEHEKAKEEAILLSIGDGLLATDEKGKIMRINKVAERMLGIKSREIMGKVFSEVVIIQNEKGLTIPLEKHPINMALAAGATTTTTVDSTYYFSRKDTTRFPVAITVTPVIMSGKVIGAIEIFRDITKEKDIDKAKTEFVSLASHQLRTPLTTIRWYAEMILNGDVGEIKPGLKKYLEEIYHGNQRMIELVNTLLDVSRIELGTFIGEPKPIDMIALAESVLDEQRPKIEQKNLKIIRKFSGNVPVFLTNPKLFRIVFQNILANAVEYTPPDGKIEFSISLDDRSSSAGRRTADGKSIKNILIQISDTGYGIPKNQQTSIFTKLFRADNVRDKETDGTGLGLYIVKSIVENCGGKIWFESPAHAPGHADSAAEDKHVSTVNGENPGTTFFVTIPLDGMKKKEGAE